MTIPRLSRAGIISRIHNRYSCNTPRPWLFDLFWVNHNNDPGCNNRNRMEQGNDQR